MDSPTGFDHDDFFGSYDAEQASAGMSMTPHEFDDAGERPPSQEQLAHWGRFRKPVGMVIAAMTLLSLVALGKGSSREAAWERPLVAHYGSALAAAAPSAHSIETQRAAVQEAPSGAAPGAPPELLPKELTTFVAEVWSSFEPSAPSLASATVPLLVTDDTEPSESPDAEPAGLEQPAGAKPEAAFVPAAAPMCLLPPLGSNPAPLDASRIHGQAPEAWSLPPSMTSSTPFERR